MKTNHEGLQKQMYEVSVQLCTLMDELKIVDMSIKTLNESQTLTRNAIYRLHKQISNLLNLTFIVLPSRSSQTRWV
jgi:predicted  nucleic acid-binding Zn-ribbon protein